MCCFRHVHQFLVRRVTEVTAKALVCVQNGSGMKEALIHPKHPERICWGCERYCAADNLACREERLVHPIESDGYDWPELEQANATEIQDRSR